MNEQKNAVATTDKGKVTYQVAGQDVTLSYDMVRQHLVKGGGDVTDTELLGFIAICKYNHLNPFLNEAYLVKFKGQNPTAQMIVSKEALMKRAEACSEYDGMKAGIIVKRGSDLVEIEGTFFLSTDVLLGGWAEVYRKDREFPYISKVSLAEYDKKQSTWNDKKSTMIRKTAIVQAMREAFPAQLGTMYTAEERGVQDVDYIDVTDKVEQEKKDKANKTNIGFDAKDDSRTDPPASETTEQAEPIPATDTGEQKNDNNPGF